MTEKLEAWLDGAYAGQFVFPADEPVQFAYDDAAPEMPVSLSLPRSGAHQSKAAGKFLDNLLPETAHARRHMAEVVGASSPSVFELLSRAGGDVAGGLVLLPEGEAPSSGPPQLRPISEAGIASRIARLKESPDEWTETSTQTRFSLAGTQGKFALANLGGRWFLSNSTVPSTHIFKPARPDLGELESAESAALALAADIGISSTPTFVHRAIDQSSFVTTRFDRELSAEGFPRRIHAEDFAQASGRSAESKYGMSAVEVFRTLKPHDSDESLRYGFVEQLAFNVAVGNADAHAKNYSILIRPDRLELSPIYDVVPLGLYPEYDQHLAMHIGGADRSKGVAPPHWRKLAKRANLDPDRVADIAANVAYDVRDRAETAWEALPAPTAGRLRDLMLANTAQMLAEPAVQALPPAPGSSQGGGQHRRKDLGQAGNGGQFAAEKHRPPGAF